MQTELKMVVVIVDNVSFQEVSHSAYQISAVYFRIGFDVNLLLNL